MKELSAGDRVGNYTLIDLLGKTGMGEVWRAQEATGTIVALKTISSQAHDYDMLRERFLREIAIHQNLKHPSIVPIHDFFELENRLYLVMDYIPGGSLEHRLDSLSGQPMPVDEAMGVSQQILRALDFAHQNFVIHRDVKPSNILLDNGRAYLTDFGISLPVGAKRLTSVKQVVGTRFYMSPEQILDPLNINHLTDVFSFGCVLYEMLTGRQPFAGDSDPEETSDYAVQTRQINAMAQPLRPLNPAVSERLERIVLTSIAKKPQERFPGCGSFANALDWVAKESQTPPEPVNIEAPQPAPQPRPPATEPKPRGQVSIAATLIVVLLSALAPFLSFASGSKDAITFAFGAGAVVMNIVLLVLLYKGWASLQDGYAKLTPGKAVGFMFIPFFSLIWSWIAWVGYVTAYNAFITRHDSPVAKQPKPWYVTFVIVHYILPLLLVLTVPAALGIWLFVDFIGVVPVTCIIVSRGINSLRENAPLVPLEVVAKSA